MLNPNYNYIAFDLETTGLNKDEDEIIQIAIVKFDAQGRIIKKFSSLVQPKTVTIKDFISFLTGIDNEQIKSAPKFEDIFDEVVGFFDKNTIIIGHNIQFDIGFLQKYIPDLQYKDSIDTYHLAKQFVHFPSSYALEVLVELLAEKKEIFREIQNNYFSDEKTGNHHDAMTDTLNSWCLFWYCIQKIFSILDKYPVIRNLFKKIDGLWSEILILPKDWKGKLIGNITLPVLETSKKNESILVNKEKIILDDLTDTSSFYIGNSNLKTVLEKLASNKNTILCFDSLHKLNIAKNILSDLGISTGAMYDQQTIDGNKLKYFLNKEKFDTEELFFVLKYLSTKLDGYSIIQTNTPIDYKIMHYLRKPNKFAKSSLILATHNALFANIKNEKINGYTIAFFDSDWRYKNYNQRISRNVDGYGLVYFLETLLYTYRITEKQELLQELELMYDKVLMFVGLLSLESKNFLKSMKTYDIKGINPLVNNKYFTKTISLWKEILQMQDLILGSLASDDIEILQQKFDEIDHILNSLINISQKTGYDGTPYFVLSENITFTDWSEFIEIFNQYHTIFFSHTNKSYPNLIKTSRENIEKIDNQQYIKESRLPKILQRISEKYNNYNKSFDKKDSKNSDKNVFFILSTKKFESQTIFNTIIRDNNFSDRTILAENITGGAGKNIFKTQKSEKTIIIGGYQFLLNLYAHDIFPQSITVHNMYGSAEKNILSDIIWYGKQKENNT